METKKFEFTKHVTLNMVGMIGLALYILADTFFVANTLGEQGLAALNIAVAVFGLTTGFGLMIGIGGGSRYSIYKAQHDQEKCDYTFTLSMILALCIGLVFTVVGLTRSQSLASLLGANEEILDMSTTYLKTILVFAPFFIINHAFTSFLRNDNAPKLAMYAMLVSSLSNVVLDYIFLYIFDMGIFGAAFATCLAPIIGLSIGSIHFIKKHNGFHFVSGEWKFASAITICQSGISSFVNEISASVILVVFNLILLNLAGNTGVAAYGIIANLAFVLLATFTGLAQGVQPLITRFYGSGNMKEANKTYYKAIALSLVLGILILGFVHLNTEMLVSIFNKENAPQLQAMAEHGLRIYFIGFLFIGINIISSIYLNAIEHSKSAFMISFFRGFIGILIFAFLLSHFFGVTGVWLVIPVVEALTLIISFRKIKISVFNS